MGDFHIHVEAVGGHGCQRDKKHGELVEGCGEPTCPDCITREYVKRLKAIGCSVGRATLTHWPGTPSTVIDNLPAGQRVGSF